jgi:hypothetical protein
MRRRAMGKRRLLWTFMLTLLVGIGFGTGSVLWALPIGPGFDLLTTPTGTTTIFIQQLQAPITVTLKSNPIFIPQTDVDTIVERKNGLPAGATGRIEAEIVALSLVSANPVTISGLGTFDVRVDLDTRLGSPTSCPTPPCKLHPSLGTIDITSHDDVAGGGTFDSLFNVFTKITATPPPVGGGTPMEFEQMDTLTAFGTPWSHTPPTPTPPTPPLPGEGGEFFLPSGDPIIEYGDFFPGPIPHNGPHPPV